MRLGMLNRGSICGDSREKSRQDERHGQAYPRKLDPEFRRESILIPVRHQETSKMTSNSTGVQRGRLATPYTKRLEFCCVFGEHFGDKHAGIVNQHIDPAKSRYSGIDDLRGRVWIADVPIHECKIY